MCKDGEEGWVANGGLFRPSSGGKFVHSRRILNPPTWISKRLFCCNYLYREILFPLSFVYIMRLRAILFETSWVTFSSLVWFWHDFPEGVSYLENHNLQLILVSAFSSSEFKKFYKIDGVPRNLVGMLLEERGTKLCQRFFPFLLLCFCSFMFVMFSVLDRLFIKCKYFPFSSSGGAQVYVKKNYWITRQCWQLFEDWLFVTETVRLLFTRGHVWYPIQSTEKCPFIFSFTIFLVSFRSGEEQQSGL